MSELDFTTETLEEGTMATKKAPEPLPVGVTTDLKMKPEEFCSKISASDKRVELIGGFYFWVTKVKGIQKAREQEFAELFEQFSTMKV